MISLIDMFNKKLVGEDVFGNRYYSSVVRMGVEKRWVVHGACKDATSLQAEWFPWLHYMSTEPPQSFVKSLECGGQRALNVTGTSEAYHPCKVSSVAKKNYYKSWVM